MSTSSMYSFISSTLRYIFSKSIPKEQGKYKPFKLEGKLNMPINVQDHVYC